MYRHVVVIALLGGLLPLAACGGGNGTPATGGPPSDNGEPPDNEPDEDNGQEPDDDTGDEPDNDGEPDQDGAGQPEPDPEPTIDSILTGLVISSTSVIDASTIDANIWQTMVQPTPAELELSDLTRRSAEWEQLDERRGVARATIKTSSTLDYGGWMEHSFFHIGVWNPQSSDPLDPGETVFADVHSLGVASGSNPVSGSATWLGVVAGVDASSRPSAGNLIEGDAAISIEDFAASTVDIAFTNLRDAETGAAHGDMAWSDLALTAGRFAHNGDLNVGVAFTDRGDEFNSLTGQFYGSNHEEVGGVFIRNEITGAFGAVRE